MIREIKQPRNAKQFLLKNALEILDLFDVPQNILGFNVENIVRKQVYAMSEESATKKLDRLKELLKEW